VLTPGGITPHEVMLWAAAVYWSAAIGLLLVSTLATIVQPWLARRRATNEVQPPVSIALPVKLLEDNFGLAQESVFAQDYPEYEVLASATDPDSPAARMMGAIFARHPHVTARFLHSTAHFAKSPKVDNLVAPFTAAAHDVIFMKDCNAVLQADDLAQHMRHLTEKIGLVCAIPFGAGPANFAAHIEASILNGPHARMLYLASCLGQGFGVGKIMLFRRSDFFRAGGFDAIAHTVGEDNAAAKAMARIGLRTVFSHRPVRQELGRRSFTDVYQRQLRWYIIRRGDVLLSFLLEPFCQAIPALFAASVAAPLAGLSGATGVGATLILWLTMETLLSFLKGWRLSWAAPAVFMLREAVMLMVWLHAWTTSRVVWAKESFDARAGAVPPHGGKRLDPPLPARKEG
jgi:ceramide glucosyltransferase